MDNSRCDDGAREEEGPRELFGVNQLMGELCMAGPDGIRHAKGADLAEKPLVPRVVSSSPGLLLPTHSRPARGGW